MASPITIRLQHLAGALLLAGSCLPVLASDDGYDLLLLHARVVDGRGDAAYKADVAVRNVELGEARAVERLDLAGLVLAPGFIDTHNHSDRGLTDTALKTNKGFITQGVTTTIFGVDGAYNPAEIRELKAVFDARGVGTNYMFFVGHNGVRKAVMGMDNRATKADELDAMRAMVSEAMAEAAIGLSSGLMYLPGNFATIEEIIEPGRVAGRYGGLYNSHVRDPAHHLLQSIDECLTIAWKAGLSAHQAHIQAVSANNFGASEAMVALISRWQSGGLGFTADLYPYDGAATAKLVEILVPPPDSPAREFIARYQQAESSEEMAAIAAELTAYCQQALQDRATREAFRQATEHPTESEFSWVVAVAYQSYRIVVSETADYEGRMLTDVASEEQGPFDPIADLIVAQGMLPKITLGAIQEADVRALLKQPWAMISSDGGITGFENGGGHPRHRGSFPRLMGRYVREWGVLSLEEAVHKVTALPAAYLQLRDRGVVRPGAWADLVVFDADRIIDRSTWETPDQFSEGLMHVLVNGRFTLRDEQMTGTTHGRFLPFRNRGMTP